MNKDEMHARIYFHIPEYSVENPLSILKDTFGAVQQERSIFRLADAELYIRRNDEADAQKAAEFPDGFLYFSHTMEVYPEGDPIDVTNRILAAFWKAGIPAVCACDDEELLIEKGGYRSRNTPWMTPRPTKEVTMYRSVNEPDTFNFHDSGLLHVAVQDGDMHWTVEWAGVCPENSVHPSEQELRTEQMQLTFRNFRISRVKIYGCSIRNAQGEIVQITPDRELSEPQIQELLHRLQCYENWCANLLYGGGSVTEDGVCIEMELDEERAEDGFCLMEICCEAFIAEWEQYSDTQW